MFLLVAGVLFAAFTVNVVLGAFANAAILSDVGEMILLFAASTAFVAAILKREAAAREAARKQLKSREE